MKIRPALIITLLALFAASASAATTQPTADELALRKKINAGGEIVITGTKTIESHETVLLPNDTELCAIGVTLNYTGDPNKPAVAYAAQYPKRVAIRGLSIKSTGRGIQLDREGNNLRIQDVSIDSDREAVYFVPGNGPDGRPTGFVYASTIDGLIVVNPRAETHLRVRMATLSHLMFQFGGATPFKGSALLVLDGDASQGTLDATWDEPAFAVNQLKIGMPNTNLSHWEIRATWYEPAGAGSRVDATNAVIHSATANAAMSSPWTLHNSTVYASEVIASNSDGKLCDPKLAFFGDATSAVFQHAAPVAIGAVPTTQPQN